MVDELKLFDDFEREYLGPAKRSESNWDYLNRTARPFGDYLRGVLQEWFEDFDAPPEKRRSLGREFRSPKNPEHLSAFFELYLYQLFRNQGFEVEVEPEWELGRRPDFLLVSSQGDRILLEATGAYPSRWFSSTEKLKNLLLDYLDDNLFCPDYFLNVEISVNSKTNPSPTEILESVQTWVNKLDYDSVLNDVLENDSENLKRLPTLHVKQEAWSLKFTAGPRKPEARGREGVRPIGIVFDGVDWVTTASNIKSRIKKKYKRYGELHVPYILALNVVDPYYDQDVFLDALLGQEAISFNIETDESVPFRQPNGAWYEQRGYQKTRLSAICVFSQLTVISMVGVDPVVWHHPAATNPLNPNLLRLSQQIPNPVRGIYELRNGEHPRELLGIDETKWVK